MIIYSMYNAWIVLQIWTVDNYVQNVQQCVRPTYLTCGMEWIGYLTIRNGLKH